MMNTTTNNATVNAQVVSDVEKMQAALDQMADFMDAFTAENSNMDPEFMDKVLNAELNSAYNEFSESIHANAEANPETMETLNAATEAAKGGILHSLHVLDWLGFKQLKNELGMLWDAAATCATDGNAIQSVFGVYLQFNQIVGRKILNLRLRGDKDSLKKALSLQMAFLDRESIWYKSAVTLSWVVNKIARFGGWLYSKLPNFLKVFLHGVKAIVGFVFRGIKLIFKKGIGFIVAGTITVAWYVFNTFRNWVRKLLTYIAEKKAANLVPDGY